MPTNSGRDALFNQSAIAAPAIASEVMRRNDELNQSLA
jgi:hypothetical protein